ncbi:MAG: CPBP family intramembrane metalloprotease [Leptospirales bacterium]|nr:CPBP family intramembrane metalloprotease [Leptospirales bacterium]
MTRIVWIYCGLAYLFTWSTSLLAYAAYTRAFLTLNQLNLIYNLGALGPFLAAMICSRYFYGRPGLRKFLGTFRFRSPGLPALLISTSPVVFFLIGLLVFPLIEGRWYSFADTRREFNLTDLTSYLAWILPFITYSILEEFGWRGFMLPHLQEKYSAFNSTFLLTVFWASWHFPFFLWRFQFSTFIAFGFFFSIFVGALLITSTFNFSGGNILSVILFHFTNNLASALDRGTIVATVSTCFIPLAIFILIKYGREHLASVPRVKNFYLNEE